MNPRTRFAEAGSAPTQAGRLAEAALCIAAVADPTVDVDAELQALAELASHCPDDLPGLRAHLFDREAFRGNTRRYRDPRNSYLNEVRRRRLGIPISLSVLAMEVGRRAGVPLVGISLPGHFLSRSAEDPNVFLDAFSGRLLTLSGVATLFNAIGGRLPLDERWLVPSTPPTILRRMLVNLRQIFGTRVDDKAALWALELDVSLPDPSEESRVAHAACLARLQCVNECVAAWLALAHDAEARNDRVSDRYHEQARSALASLQ